MRKRLKIFTQTPGLEPIIHRQERPELLYVEESISGQFKINGLGKVTILIDIPGKTQEKMELQVSADYEVLCRPIFKIYKKGILKTQTLEENK